MKKVVFCQELSIRNPYDCLSYCSLLKRLQDADLWPRPKAQDIRISVRLLASTIKEFDVPYLGGHKNRFGIAEMRECVSSAVSNIESLLLDSHRQSLRALNEVLR
jgi:hypothetical protein